MAAGGAATRPVQGNSCVGKLTASSLSTLGKSWPGRLSSANKGGNALAIKMGGDHLKHGLGTSGLILDPFHHHQINCVRHAVSPHVSTARPRAKVNLTIAYRYNARPARPETAATMACTGTGQPPSTKNR